ncbi:DUF1549 domain-containing protein [Maioricimonas sp. JC845]|uniref:DUF1549 domain-containing protein n=1 Tax=Maioricimonas sp. JC845 TaxID=3232138 RepID=UPI00345ACC1F
MIQKLSPSHAVASTSVRPGRTPGLVPAGPGRLRPAVLVVIGLCLSAMSHRTALAADAASALSVWPATEITLTAQSPRQQLVVQRTDSATREDRTRAVVYECSDPSIAAVDELGVVRGVGNGQATIRISGDSGAAASVSVTVEGIDVVPPVDFERDVQPVLTRLGCNSGPCHGKQRGQNGFQLSLLGFDSEFDHAALTREARSRRVFFAVPEQSLVLTKPIGAVPHGGGVRMKRGDEAYEMLLRWIRSGAPRSVPETPELVGVSVYPTERILANGESQQLAVTATYSDGSTRDVTAMATYQSNEAPICAVDESGLMTAGQVTGEVAVMARYMGHFALVNASVPLPGDVPADYYAGLPRNNYIDEHVWDALERLKLKASSAASDARFMRRAYIDIIGRLPTADEARAFLADDSENRREQLVDSLLAHPEYAELWANKWADLLRPNPYRVGIKATLNYDAWIRDAFRKNRPWDEIVRELLTAQGSTFRDGNVTLFRDRRSPDELTTIVSQLFLGIRLECAKCHHHPFEVYGQEDFYSFAAYFAKVGRKGTGLSPPISGSEEFVFAGSRGSVKHPLTNEVLEPRPLYGEAPEVGDDPREALAAWITSKDNHYFAQTMANRIWMDLMGRGLVEPVDDLRATNPASNAPLLEALGRDFADNGFDIKHLIRRIATSHVYAMSADPDERNVVDSRYFARRYRQRLRAEVLLDSIDRITGVPESFSAMPPDGRAKEIWTHRVGSLFLDAFGRPDPNQDPPCERTGESTVVQTLHMMNAENLFRKVSSDSGRAATLAASEKTPAEIVEELYLSIYSRYPTEEELKIGVGLYENESSDRRAVTEDLMWALMNTPEFLFKS